MSRNISMPQLFSALSDPTRFAIIEQLLEKGDQTVGDLAEPYKMSAPAISRHLRILEDVDLIEREVEKQWRVCRLRRDRFSNIQAWLKRYEGFWSGRLDRLDTYVDARGR